MSARVFHAERVPPLLQHFVAWWIINGPFDLVCTSGARNDVQQLVEWAKGRQKQPDGSWVVVDQSEVVTYAMTASSSAHGHDAGADFHPVKETFNAPSGVPISVKAIYLGSKKNETPEVYAEAIRRFLVMADLAETHCGLQSGRHFPDPDLPHLQDPDWRDQPLAG